MTTADSDQPSQKGAATPQNMQSVAWPNGSRCALCLTFDFDAETNWMSRDPANIRRPGTLSQGTYGAKVGVPMLLDLLKEEDLRATFFVPGWVAENRTRRVEAIVAAGHEVGHHGYLHKWVDPDKPAEEEEELIRGLEALKSRVGITPVGYRSPAGETSSNLIRLLAENGFLYDSSLLDAVSPYRHRLPDGRSGPIELPWHWSLDDAPFMLTSISFHRPIFTNEHILGIWKTELREIHRWGGLVNVAMHPQAIGRPSRLAMLREFIAYARTLEGVWITTAQEAARAWQAQEANAPDLSDITPFITL